MLIDNKSVLGININEIKAFLSIVVLIISIELLENTKENVNINKYIIKYEIFFDSIMLLKINLLILYENLVFIFI